MTDFIARVALGESLTPVGQLRFTHAGPRQFSTFSYDPAWIENPRAFAIEPDFTLEAGPFHRSGQSANRRDALAGVFADAAPDSWGRRLLERAYGNGLSEFEYLTLSDDTCRQGAMRFLDEDGQVIRGNAEDSVPRLVDLEAITAIARAYEQGKEVSAEAMQALAGAGGSGGARPKANVRDGDDLWLAKFTSVHDQQPIERVEVATLRLAAACGIRTPVARLELADTPFPVALIQRFDRRGVNRIPYISARTALGKSGAELGSYTEIVDFIRQYSPQPRQDFRELYRRLTFTILVSNKDDHLKNHGFLYVGGGQWRLSPCSTSILPPTATRIWKRRSWKAVRMIAQWRLRWRPASSSKSGSRKPATPFKGWHRRCPRHGAMRFERSAYPDRWQDPMSQRSFTTRWNSH
ncbi:type II toxin-antitoxin system HipA family toxin [Novosphingobium sp. ST904]|uniref:type II toxin-antitoxin system HipA family toxin n=1 Tax=Novosphingobium sp. ST904 TaxID=1684385 RepID=UPI000A5A74CF|nr:HipA domain-containing protein [Novosphingobium sp. ST904]